MGGVFEIGHDEEDLVGGVAHLVAQTAKCRIGRESEDGNLQV
jgi:hypothetical protein